MKIVMLYEYPAQPAGLATQGDLLFRGLKELGVDAKPAPLTGSLQKAWLYKCYQPDVAIGVGYWGKVPEIVMHPHAHGIKSVPWLVADGWVANFQKELNNLPLVMATSGWVKEAYIRDGVSPERIVVQPIGCDTHAFAPIPMSDPHVKSVRDALGVAEDEKLILTIGGDGASKGSREMMRALAKIDSEFPKWKFVCKVWRQDRTLKQNRLDAELAEELGISHKVTYIDGVLSREFMPYLYNACDVYAGPSRQEGFGMPHVEAQACGKPVLSVDAMGIKETVVHGETGFLAGVKEWISISEGEVGPMDGYPEPRTIQFEVPKVIAVRADVDDLAKYLLPLLTDRKLVADMAHAARRHVVKGFDYLDVARSVKSLIQERVVRAAA